MNRIVVAASLVLVLVLVLVAGARADTITVGVFAPSAPFPSTAARVELASRLGDHLGKALGGIGSGRTYARAGDFAAAVKRGEIALALVDASYLAGRGGYTVIASSTYGGATVRGWQLVARAGVKFVDLKAKRVLVPSNGGRELEFVVDVMLGGEVARGWFARVEAATDTASALAALGLGNADAVVVPLGVELPRGIAAVFALPAIANPTLVAYGSVSVARRSALTAAAASFRGDPTIEGFRTDGDDAVRAVTRRFVIEPKRGPLAVPTIRPAIAELVERRTFAIERTPAAAFALAPQPR